MVLILSVIIDLGLMDYPKVIKRQMDLGTIKVSIPDTRILMESDYFQHIGCLEEW